MNARRVLRAYAIAPFAVAVPLFAIDVLSSSGGRFGLLAIVVVTIVGYVVGALMLPLFWLFESLGWQGWQFYIPTGAVVGLLTGLFMGPAPVTLGAPWTYYAARAGLGIANALVFSLMLDSPANQPLQSTNGTDLGTMRDD
jgi:hypothetical protein